MRSIGRAVWQRDTWLAMRLLETCPAAAEHVCMRGGLPEVVDAEHFATEFEAARREAFRVERISAENAGRRGRGRRQAVARMAALWGCRTVGGLASSGSGGLPAMERTRLQSRRRRRR